MELYVSRLLCGVAGIACREGFLLCGFKLRLNVIDDTRQGKALSSCVIVLSIQHHTICSNIVLSKSS